MTATIPFSLILLAVSAPAAPRTSTNYNIPTDTADAGGKRATSASYTNDGSAGGVTGLSTVAVPAPSFIDAARDEAAIGRCGTRIGTANEDERGENQRLHREAASGGC